MKNLFLKSILIIGFAIATFSSCTSLDKTLREPNVRVDLTKNDFTLSDQFSAEATSKKIIGIDFSRLFSQETGTIQGGAAGISLASIPVVGNLMSDKTANFALYQIINENPGYDVVFYPQYQTKIVKPIGIGFLMKVSTVKVTARLGKLKNN